MLPVEDSPLSEPDYDGHILKEEDKEEPDTVAGPYSGESFMGEKILPRHVQTEEQNFIMLTVKGLGVFFKHKCLCKCILKENVCHVYYHVFVKSSPHGV